MTDQAIAVRDVPLEELKEQIRLVADTEFVPGAYRGNKPAILAAMLFGKEIGLAPMESLSEVYLVDGKPTLSAKAMVKLARRAGHSINGTATETEAVVTGKRGDDGTEMTVTHTIKMAQRAGLTGKKNWKENPEDMLWARAVSRLCRRLFTDTFGALAYGPEEMEPGPYAAAYAATDDLPLVQPEPTPDAEPEPTRDEPEVIEDGEVVGEGSLFEIPDSARNRNRETGE